MLFNRTLFIYFLCVCVSVCVSHSILSDSL